MDSLLTKHYENGFNGNVMYTKGDSIVYMGSFGYAIFETNTLLNDSSVFELASCSKQFTALATVQLIEKGLINYNTKIDSVIKGFPYMDITVDHLLRHQSGLPDYMDMMNKRKVWDKTKIATNKDVIELLKKHQPTSKFEPGKGYEYSNTGYLLLASIIEVVAKMPFEDYMKEYIFKPANMTSSIIYRKRYMPADIENMTEGYTKTNKLFESKKKNDYIYWMDGIVGDGMVNSTLADLELWKQALRYNKLITEDSKQKMFTADKLSYDYGYGFVIEENKQLGKIVSHTGEWGGYYIQTYYIPSSNEYFLVLCNNSYKGFDKILDDLLVVLNQ